MHREPGILNRAYAKTVKLNPVISTQERGVEKPRAAAVAVVGSIDRHATTPPRSRAWRRVLWPARAPARDGTIDDVYF
jgi:hypothetical protein